MEQLPVVRRNWLNALPAYTEQEMARFGERIDVIADWIECRTGLLLSVQASVTYYCSPKTFLSNGNYTEWEVMLRRLPTAMSYPMLPSWLVRSEETPAGWVRTNEIEEVIRDHGGWVCDPPFSETVAPKLIAPRKRGLIL